MGALDDDTIRAALIWAWHDSRPGTDLAHEEGGFILRHADGSYTVERWPRGVQNQIAVPSHSGGRHGGMLVVATFHTHPNPEPDFQQEPSLTDIRAVRDDPDLGHPEYEGEFVIAREWVYLILRSGRVEVVGAMGTVLQAD